MTLTTMITRTVLAACIIWCAVIVWQISPTLPEYWQMLCYFIPSSITIGVGLEQMPNWFTWYKERHWRAARTAIDPRTGRPIGDHGSHADAFDFLLAAPQAPGEESQFLYAWSQGNLDEWPEYYEWLKEQGR